MINDTDGASRAHARRMPRPLKAWMAGLGLGVTGYWTAWGLAEPAFPVGLRMAAGALLARRIDHYTGLLADLPTTPRSPHG